MEDKDKMSKETTPEKAHSGVKESENKGFEPSWLIESEEELSYLRGEFGKRVRILNSTQKEPVLSRDKWEEKYDQLMDIAIKEDVVEATSTLFLARIAEKLREDDERLKTISSAGSLSDEIKKGFTGALQEGKLDTEDQLVEFKSLERWANGKYEFSLDRAPAFYVYASREERKIYGYRAELLRAVNFKREAGWNMEDLAKNPELQGFTKEETAELASVPGVEIAMRYYVFVADNSQKKLFERKAISGKDSEKFSFSEIKGRADMEVVRKGIEKVLIKEHGLDKEKALDAEQIAYNLLYLGNFFESMDSKWEQDSRGNYVRRLKHPSVNTDSVLNVPIRTAMKPMDALVGNVTKTKNERQEAGSLGEWAAMQTQEFLKRRGISNDLKIGEVVILPNNNKGKAKKSWTAETYKDKDGEERLRLFAPECYPVELLGSIFDETELTDPDTGQKRSIVDYLRKGDKIPWGQAEAGGMWVDYQLKTAKAGVVWDYFQGKEKLGFGKFGGISDWVDKIDDALAKLERRDDKELKRWLVYASNPGNIKEHSRIPKIDMNNHQKQVIEGALVSDLRYLPSINDVYFDWDHRGVMSKIF